MSVVLLTGAELYTPVWVSAVFWALPRLDELKWQALVESSSSGPPSVDHLLSLESSNLG